MAIKEFPKEKFSKESKEKFYQGMLFTRAVDNALKHLFLSGEITYQGRGFQGKGFRSLGQEAIYGACHHLKIGKNFIDNGIYTGDFVAPLIRDMGVFLAMSENDVVTALNAQAGKSGAPSEGRDFHLGHFAKGILMPAAPLAIATCTLTGITLSFKRKQELRVGISFIGDGGSSLGEWHEAINFAAVHYLPMVFCIENNQIALSTPIGTQSRVKSFADKAIGYGIDALIADGNDIEEISSAFKFAADEARQGRGPMLIELTTMRMCGHAHHDDMLYLGVDPDTSFTIPSPKKGGYVDQHLYEKWQALDPIKIYEEKLLKEGIFDSAKIHQLKEEVLLKVMKAVKEIKSRPWPRLNRNDEQLVFKMPLFFSKKSLEPQKLQFSSEGITYLQGISDGVKSSFKKHKNALLIGEDVAAPYGNAFMMFKELSKEYPERFLNAPISENAIVGACVGLALAGFLPIGEIQFNDFIACAMDQVVNNAAKTYFRSALNVPMVLRMPYGGLRRAGPYHSQDTAPWFYRTSGLKIMAPSTPLDALLMLIKAVEDPDPVLFYEHIALYRDPKIKESLSGLSSHSIDGARLLRKGRDLTIISYGAYVHLAEKIADRLFFEAQKQVEVIDLRYLSPVDFDALYASIKKTSRVLLISEDAKRGGILESIASIIGEELFSYLDAPVKVLGSKNIPVPYAPSLEDDYLLSEDQIFCEALKLIEF